ncbi:hypothetical protein [Methylorubrum extorquens]|uniref:Uncharacterized protein n=1 Tax=Methylorubrum extorquens (strain ATCC 14718 / DSM 1338 / JCM 2805 / NCIMB 9133 / AM1) TaxID=272630 RepID=C5B659_METEA|nr:hypothetical protein [Methylorubrum extorquens]ACS43941.1 Hypothetical protein MexAM1_META2p1177 [Methylorubrum extorquens AM1]MCP1546206.1 hypothetical protein [Methylorubrum extorquens]MCP1590873.1 hypothetical protein [Methylorubrum extorquens]
MSLARVLAAIAQAIRGAFTFMWDAVAEAAEPLTKRLPWARERARAAGRALDRGVSTAADVAAVTAEVALKAPGAVARELGSVVGSMLPVPPVTGRAVAEGAAITDDEIQKMMDDAGIDDGFFERQRPFVHFGHFIQHAVEAYRDGGERALARHVQAVSEPVADWIRSLSRAELDAALKVSPDVMKRHSEATREDQLSPLLPPILPVKPACLVSDEEFAAMAAQVKRNRLHDRDGYDDMIKRGARPEPRFDAGEPPAYGRGYRPRSLH